jgi:hypothetical protein
VGHDVDGAVVHDGHVLQGGAFGGCDLLGRLAQVVAAAAGDVAGQPLLDDGQRDGEPDDLERQV